MITGGDDNAIYLNEIEIGDVISCRLLASKTKAHTSTVTEVLSLGNSVYLSVSIDQIIRVWELNIGRLVCIFEAYTFVPDVCGIIEIDGNDYERRFVVYGTGMELVAFTEDEN
jgi:WD repeat-containing protein 6